MRVLLDTCIRGQAVRELEAHGHDVRWVGDWDKDPGDDEILLHAYRESRVLVTLDKDFGELAVVRGMEHSGIVRLVSFPASRQGEACQQVLERYGDQLQEGALVTAESGRIRIRPR